VSYGNRQVIAKALGFLQVGQMPNMQAIETTKG
jgi:hypothetical protein